MGTLLLILHIFVCVVLIGVVLLQSGKAADLAGAFGGGGSQTALGSRGAATVLTKATTISAIGRAYCSTQRSEPVRSERRSSASTKVQALFGTKLSSSAWSRSVADSADQSASSWARRLRSAARA